MMILRGVSKAIGQEKALRDVNISAQEGAVTALLAPSGAGKSAVCDILCGISAPDSGSVLIDGIDMEKDPVEAKRHIGYMPENPAVFRDTTPRSQLRFIGQTREMSARALSEQVEKVIKLTKLTDVANMPIKNLPDAYLQRVGIAQAIMADVKNIVLDAPTKALDAKQICELRAILREVVKGRSILLATDNLTEAEDLGDVAYVLSEGAIIGRTEISKLAWLSADSETTVVRIAAEKSLAAQAIKASGLDIEGEMTEIDGVSEANVRTGSGLEGKKQLSFAVAKAGLPIVGMQPAKLGIDEVILKLAHEPFAKVSEGEGEAE